MSENLVFALSTLGRTGLDKFNDLFKQLTSPLSTDDETINVRYQTIRFLESLGYCEFDYNQRQVYMCPPSMVLLPSFGLPRAILTGARTPELAKGIKLSVKKRKDRAITYQLQQNSIIPLPGIIIIESIDRETIQEIAEENGIQANVDIPAAMSLAEISQTVKDIEEKLEYQNRAEINWKKREFNIERLGFSETANNEDNRLTEYINPYNRQRKHWVWKNEYAADVDRDWGRYLFLKQKRKKVLYYNSDDHEFFVPLWVPLPCLLSRALTLCSGKSPEIQKNISFRNIPENCPVQVYSDVPMEIARIIAGKLEQKIF